jgi:VIT1/CCC1 family predicted Fe2+/Mn2+ transporter
VRRAIEAHLGSRQVARVIYGAIIGMALVVTLEAHPPRPGVVAGTLVATAVAVGLAELYSEVVGAETRNRRRVGRDQLGHILRDVTAVGVGIAFPAVFFVLAAAGVLEDDTAFTVAKWSGLGLISFYGFVAGRLSGAGLGVSVLQALAVGAIGGVLIAFKALVH